MARADRFVVVTALGLALLSCLMSVSVTAAEPRSALAGARPAMSGTADLATASVPGTVAPAVPSALAFPGRAKGVALYDFLEFWGDDAAGMRTAFGELHAAGVTWARLHLAYGPRASTRLAAAASAAKAHGVRLVVVLHKPPPFKDLGTPADRAAYRAWVAVTVRRFKASVHYWEIMGEPNLRYTWNIDNRPGSNQAAYAASVRRYVTLLKDGYTTVKRTDPGAVVLFGGLSESTVGRYLDVLLTTDAYRYFDIMSFHPYGRTPDLVVSRFAALRAKMRSKPGYASKPLWMTEFGFNTSWTNKPGFVTSEALKGQYLTQSMKRLSTAGAAAPVFGFTLNGNNHLNPGFGLITMDKSTRKPHRLPAFTALRNLRL
jgi:hypothetical protein